MVAFPLASKTDCETPIAVLASALNTRLALRVTPISRQRAKADNDSYEVKKLFVADVFHAHWNPCA